MRHPPHPRPPNAQETTTSPAPAPGGGFFGRGSRRRIGHRAQSLIDAKSVAIGLLLACAGCANPTLAWAPRLPGPPRPAKDSSLVQVLDIGKPRCPYEVIGSAFGASLDDLKATAAAHGGDGVYDTSCVVTVASHVYFSMAHGRCDGRVFVCKGPSAATGTTP